MCSHPTYRGYHSKVYFSPYLTPVYHSRDISKLNFRAPEPSLSYVINKERILEGYASEQALVKARTSSPSLLYKNIMEELTGA